MIDAEASFLIVIAAGIKAEDRIKEVIESLDLDGLNGPSWILQELVKIWKASGPVALQPIQFALFALADKLPAFEDYDVCIGPHLLVTTLFKDSRKPADSWRSQRRETEEVIVIHLHFESSQIYRNRPDDSRRIWPDIPYTLEVFLAIASEEHMKVPKMVSNYNSFADMLTHIVLAMRMLERFGLNSSSSCPISVILALQTEANAKKTSQEEDFIQELEALLSEVDVE